MKFPCPVGIRREAARSGEVGQGPTRPGNKEMQDDANLFGGNAAAARGRGVSCRIAQMPMPKPDPVAALECEVTSRKVTMKEPFSTMVGRRDLLLAIMTTAAAMNAVALEPAAAKAASSTDKRKARYQANSAEVQDFYRVNRYPAR